MERTSPATARLLTCPRGKIGFGLTGEKTPYKIADWFGSLAQLVEQRTFNPLVAGSNPARPTKQIKHWSHFPGEQEFPPEHFWDSTQPTAVLRRASLCFNPFEDSRLKKRGRSCGRAPSPVGGLKSGCVYRLAEAFFLAGAGLAFSAAGLVVLLVRVAWGAGLP